MSQPAPKGQMIQIFLFAAMLFLGWQMFTQKSTPDPRGSAQILADLRGMNTRILDHSIVPENSKLSGKVDEEVKAGKITQAEGDKLKLAGTVLVADTQYRAGILWNDFSRIMAAFTTLQPVDRAHQADTVWLESPVELGPHQKFPQATIKGRELYHTVIDDLTKRSKTDLIFGVVPGYQLIDSLVAVTGRVPGFSYWFAAMALALFVRLAVFPLAQKQYMFGRMMSRMAPLTSEIKAQYTDKKTGQVTNQTEMQQKTMDLYREYGINPFQGCWPMFIQLPFFLLIYQCMLHYRFEFQKGTFAWVNAATSQATNGFVAPNLGERDYILIALYAITMISTTLMTPATAADPAQAKQSKIMGVGMAVVFAVVMFFWPLPSAFVLYWVFTNVFATGHMLYAYRQPLPPLEKVNAPNGGVFPSGNSWLNNAMQKNGAVKNGVSSTGMNKPKTGTPVKHRPKKKK